MKTIYMLKFYPSAEYPQKAPYLWESRGAFRSLFAASKACDLENSCITGGSVRVVEIILS